MFMSALRYCLATKCAILMATLATKDLVPNHESRIKRLMRDYMPICGLAGRIMLKPTRSEPVLK